MSPLYLLPQPYYVCPLSSNSRIVLRKYKPILDALFSKYLFKNSTILVNLNMGEYDTKPAFRMVFVCEKFTLLEQYGRAQ